MARRLLFGIVLASAAGIALSACSGSSSSTSGNPGKSTVKPVTGAQISWAAHLCDVVGNGGSKLKLPTASGGDLRTAYVTFLNGVSTQLKNVETALTANGAPPVTNGQATVTTALTNLRSAEAAIGNASNTLKNAKDARSFQTAVTQLNQSMARYTTYQGPIGDLRANPTLARAFDSAQSCKVYKL